MSRPYVLGMKTMAELETLRVPQFLEIPIHPLEFRHVAEICGARWMHSGKPCDPHAELSPHGGRGLCADSYLDVPRILGHTNLCDILADALVRRARGYLPPKVDWVVGSDSSAIPLARSVAMRLGANHGVPEKGPNNTQVWKGPVIPLGDVVLQVEDVVNTSQTLRAVRQGILAAHAWRDFFSAPAALALVHYHAPVDPDADEWPMAEGLPLISFIQLQMNRWKPEECPLCAAGSERLRPKMHWAELMKGTPRII